MILSSIKQKYLLENLFSTPDLYAVCNDIVHPSYFDPEYRQAIEFVSNYYHSYRALPSAELLSASVATEFQTRRVTRDEFEYTSSEIEVYCRQRALQQVVLKSAKWISEDNGHLVEAEIKKALSISINRDIGIDYFRDPLKRLEILAANPTRTPTKWDRFDELLGGGMARKEILLFSANSGGGKSITLGNLGINFLEQGFNVLYLSLELSEEMISMRYDTMLTGIPTVAWRDNYRSIAQKLETASEGMGRLTIKHMPSGTCASTIRSYLKEYELTYGHLPDLLIVDYLDIMGSNERISGDNVWEKDKAATEELRDLAFEFNMFVATASQQNRSAVVATELNHSHIAGGISKVNTVDIYASIIMTATMRAAGEVAFHLLKTRSSDGVGKTATLKWRSTDLRIVNQDAPVNDDQRMVQKIASQKQQDQRAKPPADETLEELMKRHATQRKTKK